MFGMNLKQLMHKKKSLELLQQGTDPSHQNMTSDKTEGIRLKSDGCSQPDQIQKSVSQEVHTVYQLFVLMFPAPRIS